MDFSGQRILVLGLAREGVSLARYLARHGAAVTVTDSASREKLAPQIRDLDERIAVVVGADHPELTANVDMFFTSPGVPPSNPVYRAACKRGLAIQSMTTLFFEKCPARIVGVTGSSGKTTTTALLGQILRAAGRDVLVGGNIGDPMLDLLPRINEDTVVVLELSSFQLEILRTSPHLALITNISPNHLDRHGSMEEYLAAKRHITSHQRPEDHAVLNAGDPSSETLARSTPAKIHWFGETSTTGASVRDGCVILPSERAEPAVMPISEIPLLGRHNLDNVLAACTAAAILGVPAAPMADAIRSFTPPAHRLQIVGERNGVRYVDDSIATSPSRAAVALQAITSPVVLIAGGRDKQLPWHDFARLLVERARGLILIGEAAPHIARVVSTELGCATGLLTSEAIRISPTLDDAVAEASNLARPGDTVLLAPGCTSYDMFNDYEERGTAFARAVEDLDAA